MVSKMPNNKYDNIRTEVQGNSPEIRAPSDAKFAELDTKLFNQTENNHLNYLIDPKFNKINKLFVLSLESENDR